VKDYRVKTISSLSRGFEVLGVLQEMRFASLHDLHRATGIPKSSLLRILATAYQHGLVWQRMADGAFVPRHSLRPRIEVDDAEWLAEVASPVLELLSQRVKWPSVLSVPRLEYMETVETNSSRAYFDELPPRPRGYRVNMLRSASGRAYLAYCPPQEREAVLTRLREKGGPAHRLAADPNAIRQIVESTRHRGYATRALDFGGDYELPRSERDDARESIALPVRLDNNVVGAINLTWRKEVFTIRQMARLHLPDLRRAVTDVERMLASAVASAH
jgi:IclR family mhp operon transcriptional activator